MVVVTDALFNKANCTAVTESEGLFFESWIIGVVEVVLSPQSVTHIRSPRNERAAIVEGRLVKRRALAALEVNGNQTNRENIDGIDITRERTNMMLS